MNFFLKYFFAFFLFLNQLFAQHLASIDLQIMNHEFENSKLKLEKLYNNSPKDIEVLTRLSIVHHFISEKEIKKSIERENANKAFEFIQTAYSIDPENPQVLKWYVIALGKTVENQSIRNQIEESKNIEKIALKVIEILPNDEYCYNILGQWHYRLASLRGPSRRIASILFAEPPVGSFDQAKFFLERSLEINPNYIGTYYWLGKTYIELNNIEKAIDLFQKGIILDRPFKREEEIYKKMVRMIKDS